MKRSTFIALLTAPFILKKLPARNPILLIPNEFAEYFAIPSAKLVEFERATFTQANAADMEFVNEMEINREEVKRLFLKAFDAHSKTSQ
jgi:hypothetical protein